MKALLEDTMPTSTEMVDPQFPTGVGSRAMNVRGSTLQRCRTSIPAQRWVNEEPISNVWPAECVLTRVMEPKAGPEEAPNLLEKSWRPEADLGLHLNVELDQSLARVLVVTICDTAPVTHFLRSLEMLEALHGQREEQLGAAERALARLTGLSQQLSHPWRIQMEHISELSNWVYKHDRFRHLSVGLRGQSDFESGQGESEEEQTPDVVGLQIPRKRVVATLDVDIDVRSLPKRKPYPVPYMDTEDEDS